MSTIKPIDSECILKAAREVRAIITIEDHNIYGGLGSAVAEILAEEVGKTLENQIGQGIVFERMGIPDHFTRSGAYEDLLALYGLGAQDIARKVRGALKLKI